MERDINLIQDEEILHPNLNTEINIDNQHESKREIERLTVIHDSSMIKVGKGNIDVSERVISGPLDNMTIKGQTYQNILPDPSLRNEMQGKSTQRLNEGCDSIETVDGVSKSAILKGQTLVNVDSYYSVDDFSDGQITSLSNDGWVEMVANGNYRNAFTRFNGMIKPNTKYLAVVEVKENTLVNETLPERPFYLFANYSNPDGGVVVPFVDQTKWISQGQKGLFKYILTSRGDLSITTINLRNFVANTTTSGRIIYRTMLIEYVEGMENWDIPFFRGIQSVKNACLQTLGSNIFDGETERGYIDPFTGQNSNTWNDLRSVGYTEVVGGNKIRILVTHENFSSPKIYEYDENKNFIGKVENHTLSPHAKFVRFSIGGNTDVGGVSQVMLYYGDIVKREYEPYKTNILSTPSDLELRGIGDVKDELNCLTGELTQRIRDVTLNGETTRYGTVAVDSYIGEYATHISKLVDGKNEKLYYQGIVGNIGNSKGYILTNGFIQYKGLFDSSSFSELEEGLYRYKGTNHAYICISASRLTEHTFEGVKKFLSENPQSYLVTNKESVIKTVDLSSHGNWEKVILDGSNSITYGANWNDIGTAYYTNLHFDHPHVFSDRMTKTGGWSITEPDHSFALRENNKKYQLVLVVHNQHTNGGNNVQGLKQYLSQNPITFWYQTTTTQDNSIREMLSFANGHLQVSSEAENSLLPSVQYEIPTKNSYHMDLMKTNTLYTMKAKSVSGTFTIDGTSYNVNTNGTFTSPSSMTDKLLIMSNKTNKEVMLLEGNVIDKTIPYFKGIKSAFEGEEDVEIISTGKNLFDWTSISSLIEGNKYKSNFNKSSSVKPFYVKKGEKYVIVAKGDVDNGDYSSIYFGEENLAYLNDSNNVTKILNIGVGMVSLKNNLEKRWIVTASKDCLITNIMIHGSGSAPIYSIDYIGVFKANTKEEIDYEPYKSANTTKIPLLSPLRSLPNGVCDELIIDRLNQKVKLIQRVGRFTFDEKLEYGLINTYKQENYMPLTYPYNKIPGLYEHIEALAGYYFICNLILEKTTGRLNKHEFVSSFYTDVNNINTRHVIINIKSNSNNEKQKRLLEEPVILYYELETPIITEIDLEGYPYIYKNGHIFLNSDIPPISEINYRVTPQQEYNGKIKLKQIKEGINLENKVELNAEELNNVKIEISNINRRLSNLKNLLSEENI